MAQSAYYHISEDRLSQVTERVQAGYTSRCIPQREVQEFCLADWPESDHQDWLDTAPVQEIADWVIAGQL